MNISVMHRTRALAFVALVACNGAAVPVARNETPPPAYASSAPPLSSAVPLELDAGAAVQSEDASLVDAAGEDLRKRVHDLPLVHTLPALPPPPREPPPPPPRHDLEVLRMRAPMLRDGGVRTSEGLPPEVVRRIVRQNFGRFRLCYETAVRGNPDLKRVTLAVRFAIDMTGSVVLSEPVTGDSSDPFYACVARGFRALSFPQPEGVSLVAVEYTIQFAL